VAQTFYIVTQHPADKKRLFQTRQVMENLVDTGGDLLVFEKVGDPLCRRDIPCVVKYKAYDSVKLTGVLNAVTGHHVFQNDRTVQGVQVRKNGGVGLLQRVDARESPVAQEEPGTS